MVLETTALPTELHSFASEGGNKGDFAPIPAKCLRCGRSWYPRVAAPKKCKRCGSYGWNTPLQRSYKRRGEFWNFVDKSAGADECWPYLGYRDEKGYGRHRDSHGPLRQAHRIAYELTHGSLAADLVVAHSCDNPPCCNPSHLSEMTQAQNIADAISKGHHISVARKAVAS